jgi:hypothetical protein
VGKDSLLPVQGGPGRVASSKFGEEAGHVGPSLHSCRAVPKLMESRFIGPCSASGTAAIQMMRDFTSPFVDRHNLMPNLPDQVGFFPPLSASQVFFHLSWKVLGRTNCHLAVIGLAGLYCERKSSLPSWVE